MITQAALRVQANTMPNLDEWSETAAKLMLVAADEIDRAQAERDEWKEKWISLAQAALIAGGASGQHGREEQ